MPNAKVFEPMWDDLLVVEGAKKVEWVWEGFLAHGNITLFTSMWKSGKSTLLSLLLRERARAGTLGGCAVKDGKTLVVTEESPSMWAARAQALDLG